jgi:pantoate--beta-alanine ligase
MQVIRTIAEMRRALAGKSPITLVPTMGNLHPGHVSLVRIARALGGTVVTSIFVNPLQFGPNEDFATYPRTLAPDCALLAAAGCDFAFVPSEQEMYTPASAAFTVQPPAPLADILEGSFRPGFFTGVCTVVLKLFNIVCPDAAVFGKKDYQQLMIIQHMVQQLQLPIKIIASDTVRDLDGLAFSSRNGYLDPHQRQEAAHLNTRLKGTIQELRAGSTDWANLERAAIDDLKCRGWQPDYVAIRNQIDLGPPITSNALVVLAAARLDGVRLIDNGEV